MENEKTPDTDRPGRQSPGAPVTLEDLAGAASRHTRDIGGLIARMDHLETQARRIDRQVLMMVGMVTVLIYSVRQIVSKLPAEAVNAPDA
jgi:hypothetical protein